MNCTHRYNSGIAMATSRPITRQHVREVPRKSQTPLRRSVSTGVSTMSPALRASNMDPLSSRGLQRKYVDPVLTRSVSGNNVKGMMEGANRVKYKGLPIKQDHESHLSSSIQNGLVTPTIQISSTGFRSLDEIWDEI